MEDPTTTAYRTSLPLLLAALPHYSSIAAQAASPSHNPPPANLSSSKCGQCRAEVIGGLSGSYWLEGGSVWARCDGCGWTTKREQGGGDNDSKRRFGTVKRRKTTNVTIASTVVSSWVLEGRSQVGKASSAQGLALPIHAGKARHMPSTALTHPSHPHTSTSTKRSVPTPALDALSTSPFPKAIHPNPIPVLAVPLPISIPESRQPPEIVAVDGSARKKKRTKQPSGLAEMLEAKRRAEKNTTVSLGLSDFLQGI
ncbi:hypothetical protein P7C70_g3997, partial [Phenoliferia sp. Uapishka_3]